MRTIVNLLWVVFGGFIIAFEYVIASLLLMLTVVGIPFAMQTLKLADLSLWPFGRDTRTTKQASGCLSVLMNFIWILFGGILIFLTHMFLGLLLYITIIGIPFGKQHFKLSALAFSPFGREVYSK